MKSESLRNLDISELHALADSSRKSVFESRMKAFTGQLEDTSGVRKARRLVARINTVLSERLKSGEDNVGKSRQK